MKIIKKNINIDLFATIYLIVFGLFFIVSLVSIFFNWGLFVSSILVAILSILSFSFYPIMCNLSDGGIDEEK